jgi:vancomycin resistance protein YoaR
MTTEKTAATTIKAPAKKLPVKKSTAPAKSAAKAPAKPGVKAAPKPAAKKPKKEHKEKVVRDSFTMPQSEYAKIAEIKAICLKTKMHVKKSEVLRAGLKLLAALNAAQLKLALDGLEKIKTGRPLKP